MDEIFKLISINAPLYNASIRNAVMMRVKSARLVSTNRSRLPSQIETYKKTDSFVEKSRAEYLSDPEMLPVILLVASPHHYVTVSYLFSSLRDIHSFLRLVHGLPMTFGVRYNVELEFNPGMLHVVDLLMIVDEVSQVFGDSLKILMITNYHGDLRLDMTKFTLLEALWLANTNVTFTSSFEQNLLLERLVLHPNCDGVSGNNPITIDRSLPPNLVLLRLGQSVIVDLLLQYPFPEKISDLTVMTVRDTLMKFMPRLFEHSHTDRTCVVYQSALAECSAHANSDHIQKLVNNEPILSKLGITSIKNENGIWDFSAKTSITHFKISKCDVRSLHLPPHITHLDLSNNNIVDVSNIVFGSITPALISLNISDNPIDWSLMPEKIHFPPNLEELRMNNANIGAFLKNMHFPELLKQLHLEVNQIERVNELKIYSSNQLELYFGCNLIQKAEGHWLPVGVRTIQLTENFMIGPLDLSRDILGNTSCLEQVYLNNNHLLTLSDLKLPQQVRILNLDECSITSLDNIEFPSSVEELSINGCELESIRNVSFGMNSRLKVLSLAQNRLTQMDVKQIQFPPTLLLLNLSGNLIKKLSPHDFAALKELQLLSLSWNKLRRAELQLNGRLQNLDLSYNQILQLQLWFPGCKESQLAELNLSMNKLTALTPDMIGHNLGGTTHANLLDIDVTGNAVDIEDDLMVFPESLMCMVEGISGIQDRYGYDIGANLLGNGYCLGKRIDVPSL